MVCWPTWAALGVDPVSWTLHLLGRRSPRCRNEEVHIRRGSGDMVELVRSGRNPEELSREFEPTAQAIRNWVAQADRDEGRRAPHRHALCAVRGRRAARGRGTSREIVPPQHRARTLAGRPSHGGGHRARPKQRAGIDTLPVHMPRTSRLGWSSCARRRPDPGISSCTPSATGPSARGGVEPRRGPFEAPAVRP
jgi:hypothetical protein